MSEETGQRKSILVVDDVPENMDVLVSALADDYRIRPATNAETGLKIARSDNPPDLILLDIMMPGMNGYEVCEQLKADRTTARIPVIFVTGMDDPDDASKGLAVGAVDYITRPCHPAIVQARVRTHLELAAARRNLAVLAKRTLTGTVRLLSDVLAISNPAAFSRASRLRRYARAIIRHLGVEAGWQLEIAAELSQLGCITIPAYVLEAIHSGQPVTSAEESLYQNHPEAGARLLRNIPRFEFIAEIVRRHHEEDLDIPSQLRIERLDRVRLGLLILKVCREFDRLVVQGNEPAEAIAIMRHAPEDYHPAVVGALAGLEVDVSPPLALDAAELQVGDILAEDLFDSSGVLVAMAGMEVSEALLQHVQAVAETAGLEGQMRVRRWGSS